MGPLNKKAWLQLDKKEQKNSEIKNGFNFQKQLVSKYEKHSIAIENIQYFYD